MPAEKVEVKIRIKQSNRRGRRIAVRVEQGWVRRDADAIRIRGWGNRRFMTYVEIGIRSHAQTHPPASAMLRKWFTP